MKMIRRPRALSFSSRKTIARTRSLLSIFTLLILFNLDASSQKLSEECRTKVNPAAARVHESKISKQLAAYTENYLKQRKEGTASLSPVVVPIVIHIVRRDDGTGGINVATVRSEIINFVNTRYAPINVSFAECGAVDYINSSAYFDISGDAEGDAMSAAHNVANVLNIYFVNDPDGACGWARFTSMLPVDYIVIANGCADNTSTLAHEIGHYFDLYHTHETAFGAECVNGSNCGTAGDLICDTPADPDLSGNVTAAPGCSYTGTAVDGCSSAAYNPSTHNIMSYSQKACRDIFTAQQNARVLFTIANARSYLNYSCCVAPVITCPGNVIVNNTANQCGAIVNYAAATATGSEPMTITYSKASGTFFPVGTTVVTATATNSCGTQSCTFNVTVNDNQLPAITCPMNISATNDESLCGAVINYTTPVGTDNCPGSVTIRTAGLASGSVFPVGTTINTFRVTDASGNVQTCSFNVTVTDTEDPVITAPPVLSCYEAGNYGCNINLGVIAIDNCGIQSLTSDAPACFPVGTTVVTWTAVDIYGNTATATQEVTRNPEIQVDICAELTRRIYTGTYGGFGPFGPQSINLSSSASGGAGGFTYSWSPAAGLNNPNIANPVASPAVTTNYVLTVTDSKGCTRSLGITIYVLPLSEAACTGNGNGIKFNICHVPKDPSSGPNNICISGNAVPSHLPGSGEHSYCTLGPCGQQLCFSTAASEALNTITSTRRPVVTKEEFSVYAYPNPSAGDFTIQVNSKSTEPVTIRVLDLSGTVKSFGVNNSKTNTAKVGADLPKGTYYAEVIQGTNKQTIKLVKIN